MKIYAVRATKEEKNFYYILFIHDKDDKDAMFIRVADLIERSHKMEFDEVCSWPLALVEEEVKQLHCPLQNNSETWFFLKKVTEEVWTDLVTRALAPVISATSIRTVIV